MEDRRQIRAHVRWKLRLQNDVQTEGRPRPPPGNTVITIITYRALILISPSYVSLSLSLFFTHTHIHPPSHAFLSYATIRSYLRFLFNSRSARLVARVDIFPRPFTRADQLRFIIARERHSSSLTRAFDWVVYYAARSVRTSVKFLRTESVSSNVRWLLHV